MKKALCRWLEKWGLEDQNKQSKNKNINAIVVVQEVAFMADFLKRSQAVLAFLRLRGALVKRP